MRQMVGGRRAYLTTRFARPDPADRWYDMSDRQNRVLGYLAVVFTAFVLVFWFLILFDEWDER